MISLFICKLQRPYERPFIERLCSEELLKEFPNTDSVSVFNYLKEKHGMNLHIDLIDIVCFHTREEFQKYLAFENQKNYLAKDKDHHHDH